LALWRVVTVARVSSRRGSRRGTLWGARAAPRLAMPGHGWVGRGFPLLGAAVGSGPDWGEPALGRSRVEAATVWRAGREIFKVATPPNSSTVSMSIGSLPCRSATLVTV